MTDLHDEPSTDPPRIPPASADVMPTFESKVQRAEELLLRGGAWVRARAEPGINMYNAQKKGAPKFNLRVVVKTRGRTNEFRSNSQQAKLPNGATLYDGGAAGVFDNEATAASHMLRFRLWVELSFPDMTELISEMSDEARRRVDLQRQAAGNDARKRKAGKLKFVRKKRRSMEASEKYEKKAKEYDKKVAQLTAAVEKIYKHDLLEALKIRKGRKSKSVSVVRQQIRIRDQCMVCRHYYMKLAQRERKRSGQLAQRAHMIENILNAVKRSGGDAAHAAAVAAVDATAATLDGGGGDGDGDPVDDAELSSDHDDAAYDLKHDIAAEVGKAHRVSGRQVRRWVAEFQSLGSFRLDQRGLASPEHLLDEEDVLQRIRRFLFEKAGHEGKNGLNVDKFHRYVNSELLPSLAADAGPGGVAHLLDKMLAKKEDGSYIISRTAAWDWMRKAGAERAWHKQGSYTDVHEKPEVHAARVVYLVLCAALQLREKTWVHLPKKEYEAMVEAHNEKAATKKDGQEGSARWRDVVPRYEFVDKDGNAMVEVHVDQFDDTDSDAWKKRRVVSARFKPAPAAGVANPPTARRQAVDNASAYAEMMVERCDRGCIKKVCRCHMPVYRLGHDEAIFKAYCLPHGVWIICGVRSIRKKSDGPGEMVSAVQDEVRGFGFPMTEEELELVNAFRKDARRPELKESPGKRFLKYGKNKEGYWDYDMFADQVAALLDCIEVLYPDHQIVLEVDWSQGHAKKMPQGLYVADVNLHPGGTQEKKGTMRSTNITAECLKSGELDGTRGGKALLEVGGVQHFAFRKGDRVNPHDAEKCTLVKENKHVGQLKGLRQILWERGLWQPDEKLTLEEGRARLKLCADFANEPTALQHLLAERGHLLVMTPKAHPELAGKGIEYSWGKAKRDFRQLNDCVAAHLRANVEEAFKSLDLPRVFRFARRTREWGRAYARQHGLCGYEDGDARLEEGFASVDKFIKECKTHRCILDQEWAFCA